MPSSRTAAPSTEPRRDADHPWREPSFASDLARELPPVLVVLPLAAVVLRWISDLLGDDPYPWEQAFFLAGFLAVVHVFGETRKVRRERRREAAAAGADVRIHARLDYTYVPFLSVVIFAMGIASFAEGGGLDVTLFLFAVGAANLVFAWLDRRKRQREQAVGSSD